MIDREKHILVMFFTLHQEEAVINTSCWKRCFAAQLWLILYSYICYHIVILLVL